MSRPHHDHMRKENPAHAHSLFHFIRENALHKRTFGYTQIFASIRTWVFDFDPRCLSELFIFFFLNKQKWPNIGKECVDTT